MKVTKKIKKKKKKDSLEKEPPKSNAEILEMKSKIEVKICVFCIVSKATFIPKFIFFIILIIPFG